MCELSVTEFTHTRDGLVIDNTKCRPDYARWGHWLCGCAALPVSSIGPLGMNSANGCGTIAGLDTFS
ncbi:hypothetical protein GCM10009730_58420 [Streptomyces albidochromogenes]